MGQGLGERLREAIEVHWRPPEGRGSARNFQRRFQLENEGGGLKGITYPAINAYLMGTVNPPLEWVVAAAGFLGVRPEWLAVGSGEPTHALEAQASAAAATAAARLDEWRGARGLRKKSLASLGLGSQEAVRAVMRADDTLEYAGLGDEDRLHVLAAALRGLVAAEAAFDLRKGSANYGETLSLRGAVRDPRSEPEAYALWADQVLRAFLGCVRGLGVPLSRRERALRGQEMVEVASDDEVAGDA